MAVSRDGCCRQIKAVQPFRQHQRQAVVLTGGVPGMARLHVLTILGCLKTEMQSEVVHTAFQRAVGDGPLAEKRGETGSIGAFQRIHQIDHLAIEPDECVVTDLIFIAGMGRLKRVDRRCHPVHGFVQNHHPG
ncbi:MAG: Uncharacterised protein [Synechococcus sp. CC9902]|nr:MAG: Uncharacterised protein [Synechococcus sp. CC9902]